MQKTPSTENSIRAVAIAALIAVSAVLSLLFASAGYADMRRDTLKLVTSSGEHVFDIEIADTPEEKARGLMFRRSLADNGGMLFPYLPPQEATMWMRNTYISLDMVFIRLDGVVHRVEHGTEPFSERVISSEGNVAAVLELKAGIASQIGLKPGDKAVNGFFKPTGVIK